MKFSAVQLLLLTGSILSAGHLGYIYPAGGRAGETVEVLIGGQDNWGAREIYAATDKIRSVQMDRNMHIPYLYATQKKYYQQYIKAKRQNRPLPEKPENQEDWRKNKILDQVDNLSPVQMDQLLRSLYIRPNPLQISPSINQKLRVMLEIAPDTKPGIYYLRIGGRGILSNPVPFIVGNKPEVLEPGFVPPYEKKVLPVFTPPANLNGQILPGETDIFNVRLKAGTRYYFKFYGRFFKPYVGDGVPGFFQPILELKDAAGKQVAIAERDGVEIDPVLTCTVPKDGEYSLLIRDSLYRGREDFVYRVDCGTGEPPRQKNTFVLPALPRRDYQPAMKVSGPVLISGKLSAGERHTIQFTGRKGEVKVLESLARKTGSTLDTVLRLYGPDGKLLAENDDTTPEVLTGNAMHFADSHLMVTLPADGEYTAELADSAHEAGHYYLRLDRPRPDFQLMIAPSGLETCRSNNYATTLYIRRIEGFDGPITLKLTGAKQLRLSGNVTVPPNAVRIPITFYESWRKQDYKPEVLRLTGTAETPDGKITRQAVAADQAMQAFAYTHYITAPELLHTSQWRVPINIFAHQVQKQPRKVRPGREFTLKHTVHNVRFMPEFLPPRLADAPAWVSCTVPKVLSSNPKKKMLTISITVKIAENAPAGADLVLGISLPFQYTVENKEKKRRTVKNALQLPAERINIERIKP